MSFWYLLCVFSNINMPMGLILVATELDSGAPLSSILFEDIGPIEACYYYYYYYDKTLMRTTIQNKLIWMMKLVKLLLKEQANILNLTINFHIICTLSRVVCSILVLIYRSTDSLSLV